MNSRNRIIALVIALVLVIGIVAAVIVAATGSDDVSQPSPAATTTTVVESESTLATTTEAATSTSTSTSEPAVETLQVLVTNDDGVMAEGIDALVQALLALPDTEVTVVAPAENQSGSGDTATEGEVSVAESTTASGYGATAVDGFPADSVMWALDSGLTPHIVVSGANDGQNLGPIAAVSGTVGAARTAARRDVPAIAVSQGLGEPPTFDVSVDVAVALVAQLRPELLAGTVDAQMITKIDGPTCTAGEPKGELTVPLATDVGDRDVLAMVDCSLPDSGEPADDIDAFNAGYIAITIVDPELSPLSGA